jgi:hypothetical protein
MSLSVQADRIRGMIERLDDPGGSTERSLRAVIVEVEDIASTLLGFGKADPRLKEEILRWVVRFRDEGRNIAAHRLPSAPVQFIPVPDWPEATEVPSERSQREPVTRTFDYDTTDSRTRNPGFVNRRKTASAKPFLLVTDGVTGGFAERFNDLQADIAGAAHDPGRADALLKRILGLHEVYKAELDWMYYRRVAEALESMAIQASGMTLKAAIQKGRTPNYYKGVPAEIGPIFDRKIVSGGLPTLGRGRR